MIFQLLLLASLAMIAVYAYFQRRRSPYVSALVIIIGLLGVPLVSDPELANRIANSVGIGRGADLILYSFVLVTLIAIFNLHLRFRATEQLLTRIVRDAAITRAQITDGGVAGSPGDATCAGQASQAPTGGAHSDR